jgi:hypothetical protein
MTFCPFKLMYDDRSNLTKVVIVALISATFDISLISFSCNAEAQTSGDNRPLLNTRDKVMGINSAIFSSSGEFAGILYVVPSNTLTKILPSLTATGSYTHQYIGGRGIHLAPGVVEAMGLQETRGFLVTYATAEGYAAKAGIQGGNSLADINGRYIEISRIINIPRNIPDSSNLTSGSLTSDILTYQNSSYGIRIQYPANWTVDEEDIIPNDPFINIVAFSSPLESAFDNYSETLGISMEGLNDENMTLEEYAASVVTQYNKALTDFNLIGSTTNITLGGNNPAYGLIYANRKDDTYYITLEIGTIIGDRVYYIKYSAEEKQYSNYLPTIQTMINSLEIK